MMQSGFRRIVEEELATRQLLEVENDRANEVESNYWESGTLMHGSKIMQ